MRFIGEGGGQCTRGRWVASVGLLHELLSGVWIDGGPLFTEVPVSRCAIEKTRFFTKGEYTIDGSGNDRLTNPKIDVFAPNIMLYLLVYGI